MNDSAHWAARRMLGSLSPDEKRSFAAWLADDERHDGALIRAETALALIARARVMHPADTAAPAVSRRRLLTWGAASVVAAATAGVWLLPGGQALATGVGEIRRTRLADASSVILNTQSRMVVDLSPEERRVALDAGEAWFRVAHDRRRPFVVSIGDVRVRAVGTAFSVRKLAGGADVLVTEGRVEVWRADRPDQRVAVASGRRAFAAAEEWPIVPVKAGPGIERALAWRVGRVAFAGENLDYAAAEMNRYNAVQVRIVDPELGRKPIIGRFRIDDPAGFARSVALLEDARVETAAGVIRIVARGS